MDVNVFFVSAFVVARVLAWAGFHKSGVENVLVFAKRRQKLYQGSLKRNFLYLMRELKFRINHHDDDGVVQYVFNLLKSSPV
jgi:hypothetical protein